MRAILILLVAMLAIACSPKIIPSKQETKIHYERVTDTMIMQVVDSALVSALLECDSLGRVRIKEIISQNGKLLQLNAELKDNLFKMRANSSNQIRYKEIIIMDTLNVYIKVPEPYPVVKEKEINRLFWYQKILIWIGVFYLGKTALQLAFGWKQLTLKSIFKIIF